MQPSGRCGVGKHGWRLQCSWRSRDSTRGAALRRRTTSVNRCVCHGQRPRTRATPLHRKAPLMGAAVGAQCPSAGGPTTVSGARRVHPRAALGHPVARTPARRFAEGSSSAHLPAQTHAPWLKRAYLTTRSFNSGLAWLCATSCRGVTLCPRWVASRIAALCVTIPEAAGARCSKTLAHNERGRPPWANVDMRPAHGPK